MEDPKCPRHGQFMERREEAVELVGLIAADSHHVVRWRCRIAECPLHRIALGNLVVSDEWLVRPVRVEAGDRHDSIIDAILSRGADEIPFSVHVTGESLDVEGFGHSTPEDVIIRDIEDRLRSNQLAGSTIPL
jgi:hypothetical protein